jgi:hypothetical protein
MPHDYIERQMYSPPPSQIKRNPWKRNPCPIMENNINNNIPHSKCTDHISHLQTRIQYQTQYTDSIVYGLMRGSHTPITQTPYSDPVYRLSTQIPCADPIHRLHWFGIQTQYTDSMRGSHTPITQIHTQIPCTDPIRWFSIQIPCTDSRLITQTHHTDS